MNFLAHAWLAGASPADRVGGIIGDFVKGLLPAGLPPALADGVRLHRAIDSYAETHPAFRRSRARVSAERRRVSGIMVDLFYDHFLALHWQTFSLQPLETYAAQAYALLEAEAALPRPFAELLPFMRRENWLLAYRSPERIAAALDRMSVRRLKRPNNLAGAGTELLADYAGFEADCLEFLPDAAAYAAALCASRGASAPVASAGNSR